MAGMTLRDVPLNEAAYSSILLETTLKFSGPSIIGRAKCPHQHPALLAMKGFTFAGLRLVPVTFVTQEQLRHSAAPLGCEQVTFQCPTFFRRCHLQFCMDLASRPPMPLTPGARLLMINLIPAALGFLLGLAVFIVVPPWHPCCG